jgi:hypothetical protein
MRSWAIALACIAIFRTPGTETSILIHGMKVSRCRAHTRIHLAPFLPAGLRLKGGSANETAVFPRDAPFVLSTDLDDTLVGDVDSLAVFNEVWINKLSRRGCKLVYNTGRSLKDYRTLCESWKLLVPDIFIGGCGSQIYTFDKDADGQEVAIADQEWLLRLADGWDKSTVSDAINASAALKAKVL